MIWAAIERHTRYPFNYPVWLDAWRVRRARRLPRSPAPQVNARPRRLFVDVSAIAKNDAGTGIQRIVRAIATQLLADVPVGWEVVPVSATRLRPYHPVPWPANNIPSSFAAIQAAPGDVFFGLDFALDTVRYHQDQLARFKQQGGQLWFVMYDLLPAQQSDWFSNKLVTRYMKWLGILAMLADGFHCISEPVAQELRDEFSVRYGLVSGFRTHVLPMGSDLAASRPTQGVPPGFGELLRHVAAKPTALMVGTLEPRKGHADVLEAFDMLWSRGECLNLVLVGRPGWKTEALQQKLRAHSRLGSSLFWLDTASDEALSGLYEACTGVVLASYGEGYGLPLIEALGHNKPVLARDIPVFALQRERGVRYFPKNPDAATLANTLADWLRHPKRPAAGAFGVPTWAETARSVMEPLSQAA